MIGVGAGLLMLAFGAFAQTSHETHKSAMTAKAAGSAEASAKQAAYPIDYCIVSGEKLEKGKIVTKTYDGRQIEFCCNQCPKAFEKNPQKFTKKLDDAIIAKEKPVYPLTTSVVSGEELGAKGTTPVDLVYQNRLVRLNSNDEVEQFKKSPDSYLSKLDAAMTKAAPTTGSAAH
jgi:YHS domain-containing protein